VPKRLYVAEVIGSGTRADPYRGAAAGYVAGPGAKHRVILPNFPAGSPLYGHCLALLDVPSHAAALADPKLHPLPLKALADGISAAERNTIQNKLTALGFPADFMAGVTTMRQLVRRLGKFYHPEFDEDSF
jgi:hypothetical protein